MVDVEIKNIFFFILLGGKEIKTDQLIHMLTILADLSEISDDTDFKNVGINATTIFVEKSLKLIENEQYDEFIEYYKRELLKIEKYELVSYLDL